MLLNVGQRLESTTEVSVAAVRRPTRSRSFDSDSCTTDRQSSHALGSDAASRDKTR